ncbi:MAG: hypothetical protein FJW35_06200 [Acidobacteria bacterium]|nr:hypothetical protein [Acidobacteriota bacterium]
MEINEIAAAFPDMLPGEFEDLKASIAANGLMEPVTVHEGKILDGRHRARACEELGVELQTVQYTGSDLVAFVLAKNLHRRHLNVSQRALIAEQIATLGDGQKKAGAQICAASQPEAAEILKVSRRTVQLARKIVDRGVPDLVRAVKQAEVSVNEAAKIAGLEPEVQKELLASKSNRQRRRLVNEAAAQRRRQQAADTTERERIRLWERRINRLRRSISRMADDDFPATIVGAMLAKERRRWVRDLLYVAEKCRAWCEILSNHPAQASSQPVPNPAKVGPGEMPAVDQPGAPGDQEHRAEERPVVAGEDTGDDQRKRKKGFVARSRQKFPDRPVKGAAETLTGEGP